MNNENDKKNIKGLFNDYKNEITNLNVKGGTIPAYIGCVDGFLTRFKIEKNEQLNDVINENSDDFKDYITKGNYQSALNHFINYINGRISEEKDKIKKISLKNINNKDNNNKDDNNQFNDTVEKYAKIIKKSKNIILRGAPGTGKTYLARSIASNIVSNNTIFDVSDLDPSLENQIKFTQFHPNYDYSDFVEGYKPNPDDASKIELKPGIFKKFINEVIKNNNLENATSYEKNVDEILNDFINNLKEKDYDKKFIIKTKKEFQITNIEEDRITIKTSENDVLYLYLSDLTTILSINLELPSELKKIENAKDISNMVYGKGASRRESSYYLGIYNEIYNQLNDKNKNNEDNNNINESNNNAETEKKDKNYVFIIDEINRGEISKIFGELFYSIDPGYRGIDNLKITTQYSNEQFYIPDNVYIIGTMNDIDRSVDTFDFAMRRRFRFLEVKAEDQIYILDDLEEKTKGKAKKCLKRLNEKIANTSGLNRNYQIGPSYFLKLKEIDGENKFAELWNDFLEPLLRDYVQGMDEEDKIIEDFKKVYDDSLKEDSNKNDN